jgi:hypothetical protein
MVIEKKDNKRVGAAETLRKAGIWSYCVAILSRAES